MMFQYDEITYSSDFSSSQGVLFDIPFLMHANPNFWKRVVKYLSVIFVFLFKG